MGNQQIKRLDETSPEKVYLRQESTGTFYSYNKNVYFISNDRKIQQSASLLSQYQSNNGITEKLFKQTNPESLEPYILSFIGFGLGDSIEPPEPAETIKSIEPDLNEPTESTVTLTKWQGSTYQPKFGKAKVRTNLYLNGELLHALKTYSLSRQETVTTVFNELLKESFGDLALALQLQEAA